MIRPFELRDLPTLNRCRRRGLFLDSIPVLTRGRSLVPVGAALSPLAQATGVFTSIYRADDGGEAILGQAAHAAGSPVARLTFIAPDAAIDSHALAPLLEHLIRRLGERGAQSLVAEVDEKSRTFEALRRAAFSIYSRQRIWRVSRPPAAPAASAWRPAEPNDDFAIQRLYNMLVPGLVQQVEPEHSGRHGWTLRQEGELLAFADVQTGPRGVWAQPFIHPEMEEADGRLAQWLAALRPRPARPVYICLRSYSAWLAPTLEDLGAQPGPPQAVMVRRLAAEVKKPALTPLPAINGGTEAIHRTRPVERARPDGR
jgi:hypothetical protein